MEKNVNNQSTYNKEWNDNWNDETTKKKIKDKVWFLSNLMVMVSYLKMNDHDDNEKRQDYYVYRFNEIIKVL